MKAGRPGDNLSQGKRSHRCERGAPSGALSLPWCGPGVVPHHPTAGKPLLTGLRRESRRNARRVEARAPAACGGRPVLDVLRLRSYGTDCCDPERRVGGPPTDLLVVLSTQPETSARETAPSLIAMMLTSVAS